MDRVFWLPKKLGEAAQAAQTIALVIMMTIKTNRFELLGAISIRSAVFSIYESKTACQRRFVKFAKPQIKFAKPTNDSIFIFVDFRNSRK